MFFFISQGAFSLLEDHFHVRGIGTECTPIPTWAPYGNPYMAGRFLSWVFVGYNLPRIPREHNKYYGYTVRDTPECPLIIRIIFYLYRGHDELPTQTSCTSFFGEIPKTCHTFALFDPLIIGSLQHSATTNRENVEFQIKT